jgi:hypothetical protein
VRLRPAAIVLALGVVALPAAAAAQRVPGETPVADVLQVLVLDRELVALDALGGGGPRERLELGETLLRAETRGRVGMAVTDRRVLAVGVGSAAWQEARLFRGEGEPWQVVLGERVALAVTSRRALGFDGGSHNLVEYRFGPHERVIGQDVAANVGVVVTSRYALGVSPFAGGFFRARIDLAETVEAIVASANFATVRTTRRVLTFRAPTGSWEERRRDLR